MRVITLTGTTNSGKSFHGKELAREFDALYISSGQIAAGLMDDATKQAYTGGMLSPHGDKITEAVGYQLGEYMANHVAGALAIIDGFPRTDDQLRVLNNWHAQGFTDKKMLMVNLDISLPTALGRAQGRDRDAFDGSGIVRKRHETYLRLTEPLISNLPSTHWLSYRLHIMPQHTPEHITAYLRKLVASYCEGALDV